jgi:carboxylesterase type B
MAEAYSWLLPYLTKGVVPNSTAVMEDSRLASNISSLRHRDPRENEDCLFLDVIVPQKVFENAGKSTPVPVMVYIHGEPLQKQPGRADPDDLRAEDISREQRPT